MHHSRSATSCPLTGSPGTTTRPGTSVAHNAFFCSSNGFFIFSLVQLTQNYLRLLIRTIELPAVPSTATMVDEHDPVDPAGLLIHCISGWDRTPLFVSLMRISTWADDESHWSLSPLEMLYLTIGYDWMLFRYGQKIKSF